MLYGASLTCAVGQVSVAAAIKGLNMQLTTVLESGMSLYPLHQLFSTIIIDLDPRERGIDSQLWTRRSPCPGRDSGSSSEHHGARWGALQCCICIGDSMAQVRGVEMPSGVDEQDFKNKLQRVKHCC